MAQAAAPRGTRAVIAAVLGALANLPAENRVAAFRHASTAVKEKLAKETERAKAAAKKAKPAAKAAKPTRAKAAKPAQAASPEKAVRRARKTGTAPKADMLAAAE